MTPIRFSFALLAAVLLLEAACVGRRPASRSAVFVIAGQSNAVGWSTQAPHEPVSLAMAWTPWDELVPVRDPISTQGWSPGSSPWPRFADEWTARKGRSPLLVPTARGGSCLVADRTEPGEPPEPRWDPASGDLYAAMIEQAREATSGSGRVSAVLWHQGECDWGRGLPAYRDALMRLADRVAADLLGAPVVAVPPCVPPGILDPNRVSIHDAVIEAAALHPSVFLGPSCDDVAHEPDRIHVHDVATMGVRWADALEAAGL